MEGREAGEDGGDLSQLKEAVGRVVGQSRDLAQTQRNGGWSMRYRIERGRPRREKI